ncbi:hypothetical protein ACUOFC_11900, partial [Escherichia sp. TWPC-MK]
SSGKKDAQRSRRTHGVVMSRRDRAQVRRFLREQGIAEFKLPDRVECVDSLPLTAVGKVDKKQLRQWLASRASA